MITSVLSTIRDALRIAFLFSVFRPCIQVTTLRVIVGEVEDVVFCMRLTFVDDSFGIVNVQQTSRMELAKGTGVAC